MYCNLIVQDHYVSPNTLLGGISLRKLSAIEMPPINGNISISAAIAMALPMTGLQNFLIYLGYYFSLPPPQLFLSTPPTTIGGK